MRVNGFANFYTETVSYSAGTENKQKCEDENLITIVVPSLKTFMSSACIGFSPPPTSTVPSDLAKVLVLNYELHATLAFHQGE